MSIDYADLMIKPGRNRDGHKRGVMQNLIASMPEKEYNSWEGKMAEKQETQNLNVTNPMVNDSKEDGWFCNIALFPLWKLHKDEIESDSTKNYYKKAGRRFETYTVNRLMFYLGFIGVILPAAVYLFSLKMNMPLYSWIILANKYQNIEYSKVIGNITTILIFLIPLFGMLFVNQVGRMEKRIEQINEAMRSLYDRFEAKMFSLHAYGEEGTLTTPLVDVSDCRSLMDEIIREYNTRKDVAITQQISREYYLAIHLLEQSKNMEGKINYLRYIIGNSLAFLSAVLLISILIMLIGKQNYSMVNWSMCVNSIKFSVIPVFIYALIIGVLSFIKGLYL
ncbi:MAG: hypothetical protein WC890_04850 [Candidatus Margulisiibacteriota bacterium]